MHFPPYPSAHPDVFTHPDKRQQQNISIILLSHPSHHRRKSLQLRDLSAFLLFAHDIYTMTPFLFKLPFMYPLRISSRLVLVLQPSS